AVCLCILASVLAAGQRVVDRGLTPGPTDIPVQTATVNANAFLDTIGQPRPDWTAATAVLNNYVRGIRTWHLSGPLYRIDVDSTSGKVTSFHNAQRIDQLYRGLGRTGAVACSEDAAKNLVRRLATKLGVPADAKVTNWGYRLSGTGQDNDRCGDFGATFSIDNHPVATIACDIQDGLPFEIWLK
ncbi:MAG TPA: hypothetical protein VMI31_16460, partial [Fimbriimonadaceae bacterium]|nr:hypothetical protein [Fimbriimonadaceae bacterium]